MCILILWWWSEEKWVVNDNVYVIIHPLIRWGKSILPLSLLPDDKWYWWEGEALPDDPRSPSIPHSFQPPPDDKWVIQTDYPDEWWWNLSDQSTTIHDGGSEQTLCDDGGRERKRQWCSSLMMIIPMKIMVMKWAIVVKWNDNEKKASMSSK